MYKTIKTFIALVAVSILVVGCSAHAACDAYSYLNTKEDQQVQQQHIVKHDVNTSGVS